MSEAKFKKGERVFSLVKVDGLEAGAIGTVDEDNSKSPYVIWDNPRHFMYGSDSNRWAVMQEHIDFLDKKPDADGWIEWKGGECPVDDCEVVQYRMRDGQTGKNSAGGLDWGFEVHTQSYDIVAYRLAQTAKELPVTMEEDTREHTGGSVTYYTITLANGVEVQCNDVIKALGLTYAEGNVLKAVWRTAAARQGKSKRGYDDALYDAEKVVFFGGDMIEAAKAST